MTESTRTRRVAVTGSRDSGDRALVDRALRELLEPGDILVHGDAKGFDTMAKEWARANGFEEQAFPAQWDEWAGLARARGIPNPAGAIRNGEMVKSGLDLLIAFPGNKGTQDMMDRCRRAEVVTALVRPDPYSVEYWYPRGGQLGLF